MWSFPSVSQQDFDIEKHVYVLAVCILVYFMIIKALLAFELSYKIQKNYTPQLSFLYTFIILNYFSYIGFH